MNGMKNCAAMSVRMWIVIGGVTLCAGLARPAHAQEVTQFGATSAQAAFDGTWFPVHPKSRVLTLEGRIPPLNTTARAAYDKRLADRKAGDTSFDRATWCASPGIPRLMFMPYPFEIAITGRRIAFMYSWSDWYRTVDMRGTKLVVPASEDIGVPTSMGIAVGHWQGDTLVIESGGMRDETMLDGAGLPHSDQIRLTEHLRLLSKDVLEDQFTIDDPQVYSRQWQTVMTYRRLPPNSAKEDICLDRIQRGEPAIKGD